jgi:hypothetical protein
MEGACRRMRGHRGGRQKSRSGERREEGRAGQLAPAHACTDPPCVPPSRPQGTSDPVKVFDRTPNLQGTQIISYRVSPDDKWSVLIGIAAGAPERPALAKGFMQLFSFDQQKSQPLEAHAAAFSNVKAGVGSSDQLSRGGEMRGQGWGSRRVMGCTPSDSAGGGFRRALCECPELSLPHLLRCVCVHARSSLAGMRPRCASPLPRRRSRTETSSQSCM